MILLLLSCKKEDSTACILSRGEQVTENRTLSAFNQIEIRGRLNVELTADTAEFAEITYGSNLVSGISTQIQDERLIIEEKNHCDWIRQTFPIPRLKIHYKNLQGIHFEGNDSLFCNDTIVADTFNIDVYFVVGKIKLKFKTKELFVNSHSGATETILSGNTDVLKYYTASNAPQNASNLKARLADVTTSAYNDLYINASEVMYYQIFGYGNIYLTGTQNAVKWHDSGKGAVIFQ